ncbi:hypothetical protein MPTK1_3g20730 [Marchantia polymorpha subsp. ruderalis]|uniref:Uncharacterized protein n=2 Tax=Marchantia polymorpha TaxID=3197 RepID=A0AAF6B307_MARPO|nr:hypothetical protein MARPO_0159s0002 [Marchantia polymorpha]BBN06391.1 hypothetical protein Mp_3g20730 [Marchantia polymorpha subsp. ruderalis]|eukprot:PTQ28585.1 hypothetical protein MARPO_0159s0002 [Marchantia polymorpha]
MAFVLSMMGPSAPGGSHLVATLEIFTSDSRGLISASSSPHFAGGRSSLFRHVCGIERRVSVQGMKCGAARAAVSKQKKKAKVQKRSVAGDKQWKFDELMLVWDDAFQKFCDDSGIASSLLSLSREGLVQNGRGCILMEEAVNTRPRGAASGFSNKSRYSSSASPELPFYVSSGWNACYVPLEFINDPFKAPESSVNSVTSVEEGDSISVVDQAKLLSVLKGMDRTRLQGLLTERGQGPEDAGGEEPYDPTQNEVVIMFAVTVDGQQAVGADVLKAYPAEGSLEGKNLWTFRLRDGDGSDLIP